MTVKELKEKLADFDEELPVYFYSCLEEAGAKALNASKRIGIAGFPYCRGDKPEGLGDDTPFIIISGV